MRRLIPARSSRSARRRRAPGRRRAPRPRPLPAPRDEPALLRLDRQGHVRRRRRHDLRRHRRRRHAARTSTSASPGSTRWSRPPTRAAPPQRRGECHAVEATARLDAAAEGGQVQGAPARAGPGEPLQQPAAPLRRGQGQRPLDRRRAHADHRGPRDVAAQPPRVRLEPRLQRAGRAAPRAPSSTSGTPTTAAPAPTRARRCACGSTGTPTATTTSTPTASGCGSRTSTPSTRSRSAAGGCATPRCAATRSRAGPRSRRAARSPSTTAIGDDNESEFYWGLRRPAFENVTRDEKAMGDGVYLFDPQGDLRLLDDLPVPRGVRRPAARLGEDRRRPQGPRVGADHQRRPRAPIDLEPYRLTSKPYGYSFAPDSVIVQPGETMRVRLWESSDEDDAR